MSFGESMFSAGFIQKTVKVDPNVRFNRNYLRQKQLQKVPEDIRRQTTEEDCERQPAPPAGRRAPRPTCQPPPSNVDSPPPYGLHLRRSFKSI
jgi:hypothetical protein